MRWGLSAGLEARALRCLAQREHSRQELRTKLLAWAARRPLSPLDRPRAEEPASGDSWDHAPATGDSEAGGCQEDAPSEDLAAAVDTLLDKLVQSGLLSDERFVESRVHVRQPKFGNRRIEAELRQHGVRPSPEQLSQLNASEVERARAALRARFGGVRREPAEAAADAAADDAARQARCQRFLAARGFSPEAIRQALRGRADD